MPFLVPALAAVGGALGGGAGLGALAVGSLGAGIYGASKTAGATKYAANQATQATNSNNQLQTDIYNRNSSNLTPFIQNGQGYSGKINDFLATNPFKYDLAPYEKSAGYDFRLKEGLGAVNQNQAAQNMLHSGGTLKALERYGQGFATEDQNNWFNQQNIMNSARNNNALSYLGAITGQQQTGVNAASALAGVGQNYAGEVGQNNNFNANQVGNAALVGANNTNSFLGGLANTAGTLYQQNRGSAYRSAAPATQPYDPLRTAGFYP